MSITLTISTNVNIHLRKASIVIHLPDGVIPKEVVFKVSGSTRKVEAKIDASLVGNKPLITGVKSYGYTIDWQTYSDLKLNKIPLEVTVIDNNQNKYYSDFTMLS